MATTEVDILIARARRKLALKKKEEQKKIISEEIDKVDKKVIDTHLISNRALEKATEALEMAKTTSKQKGEKGDDGYTPIKGKDYYTPEEIKEIKKEVTPIKGKDYFDGKDGKDGKDGIRGLRGLPGKDGKDGKSGRDGKDGKDGSPDTPYEIRDKLSSLKGNERLDAKAIKNLEKQIGLKITSLGGSSGGGSSTEVDPVYTADKSNIVFSYNGDVALEYTGDDITKITKNVDGTITETDLAYEYTGGLLTKLTKTKDGVSKYKTLTYTNGVLTNISAWV
jgi:hypothetical protein